MNEEMNEETDKMISSSPQKTLPLLMHGSGDDPYVIGVFTDRELAEQWSEDLTESRDRHNYYVEYVDVLELQGRPTLVPYWGARYRGDPKTDKEYSLYEDHVLSPLEEFHMQEPLPPAKITNNYWFEFGPLAGEVILHVQGTDKAAVEQMMRDTLESYRQAVVQQEARP